MSAEELAARNRLVEQEREQGRARDKRDLAVSISSATIWIASLALALGAISAYASFSADQECAVNSIWVRNFHADMKAHGYDVPPLPEEIR